MASSSWADPGLVFPSTVGKIRKRATVVSHLRGLLAKADLPAEVRFHDLRHTGITLALKQGIPVHAVAKIAGHSDPAMTLRRYAHFLDDQRGAAADAIDGLF